VRALRRSIPILLLLILLPLLIPSQVLGRTDSLGRVRILFLGEIASGNEVYLRWIGADPKFTITRVACDIEHLPSVAEAKRLARLYLPRTQKKILEDYDVLVLEDFTPDVLPLHVLDWFQDSVSKGIGIALIEFANWGGTNDIHKWMSLDFYNVFPAKIFLNDVPAIGGRTFYRVVNEKGPLNLPGIESVPLNAGHHGDISPRQGATTEAVWKGRGTPAMVTSRYGKGRTLQLDHGWDNIPGSTAIEYRYMPDYIFNQVLCIADVPYPKDLETVHVVRDMFIQYEYREKATLAVLEFVERFGANPMKVERRLDSMKVGYRDASSKYLKEDYDGAETRLKELFSEFSVIEEDLMRAKDRALLWIYIVEWTAVSGVSLLCGFLLWSLMVRRRLYKQVSTTRSY